MVDDTDAGTTGGSVHSAGHEEGAGQVARIVISVYGGAMQGARHSEGIVMRVEET
jgi:hypothetical protein